MAYAERRERNKGVRYRGMYKAADGSYRSAGVEIVCRDGSGAYGEAVKSALPDAAQCGDRWHLWHLLGEAAAKEVAEAIPLFERSLAGFERVLGPDHPTTLAARNNLARARSKRAKWFRRVSR